MRILLRLLKALGRRSGVTSVWSKWRASIQDEKAVKAWKQAGRLGPPPHTIKVQTVKDYERRFSPKTFVETGTYLGQMVAAVMNRFNEVYSIELDQKLCSQAQQRFANYRHVHILNGDSAEILPSILGTIGASCLFWLDGHYSGGITARGQTETPILQELQIIFSSYHGNTIILIDDARLFTGQGDWPGLSKIKAVVADARPTWVFEVEDDIIRTHAPFG